jgi:hypothetical protein
MIRDNGTKETLITLLTVVRSLFHVNMEELLNNVLLWTRLDELYHGDQQ